MQFWLFLVFWVLFVHYGLVLKLLFCWLFWLGVPRYEWSFVACLCVLFSICSISAVLSLFACFGSFLYLLFSIEESAYWSSLAMSVAVFVVFALILLVFAVLYWSCLLLVFFGGWSFYTEGVWCLYSGKRVKRTQFQAVLLSWNQVLRDFSIEGFVCLCGYFGDLGVFLFVVACVLELMGFRCFLVVVTLELRLCWRLGGVDVVLFVHVLSWLSMV